jgi:hypothetical protein
VTGVVRFDLQFTVGEDANVRSHFDMAASGGPFTTAQLNAAAAQAVTSFGNNLKTVVGPNAFFSGAFCTDLSNPAAPQGFASGSVTGTGGTGPMTAETCTLINFKIARRYRGGHPRIYLPSAGQSQLLDSQKWLAAYVTASSGSWASFITQMQSFGGPPTLGNQVAVSYYIGGALRATPVVDVVTAAVCNAKPGSQRRRMLR